MKEWQRLFLPTSLALLLALGLNLLVLGIAGVRSRDRERRLSDPAPSSPSLPRCLAITHVGTRYGRVVEILLCNEKWDHDYDRTQAMRNRGPKSPVYIDGWVERFRVSDAQLDKIVAGLRERAWVPATKRDPGSLQLDYLVLVEGSPQLRTFVAVSDGDLRAIYHVLFSEVTESDARKAIEEQWQAFSLE
jgi:hypothetical protein